MKSWKEGDKFGVYHAPYYSCDGTSTVTFLAFKMAIIHPGWCGSVGWASSC